LTSAKVLTPIRQLHCELMFVLVMFATVLQSCVTKLPDSVTAIFLQTKMRAKIYCQAEFTHMQSIIWAGDLLRQ